MQRRTSLERQRVQQRGRTPLLYVAPMLLLMALFVFYPLVSTLFISFFEWNLVNPKREFIGLGNYLELLRDPSFGALMSQTVAYMGLALIGNTLLPVGLALLTLQLREREAELFQSLLFVPAVIAVSVGTLIWLWFYLPAVSLVANWKYLGFNYLIALSGLKAIPTEYLEAARIDGANGMTLLRRIILPLFAPSAVFLMTSTLLQSLEQVFIPIEVLTSGGPANATNNLMYNVYQEGFKFFRAGRAAASSVALIALFAGLIWWQFRSFERRISYDR